MFFHSSCCRHSWNDPSGFWVCSLVPFSFGLGQLLLTLQLLMETTGTGLISQCCLLLSSGPQADELSNPFGQISLSRQGSTEAPDPSSAMFQPQIMSQHPQQTGFIMASPGQQITASNYSASGHTAPAQQVLQPQSYMQPPQQVSNSVVV